MTMGLDPLRQVRDVGIDQYRAGLGEYLGAVASDAWANSPVMALDRLYQGAVAQEETRRRGETLLTPEEASDRGRDIGLRFEAPIAESAYRILADAKQATLANESVFKRARLEDGYGTMQWLLAGGTEFLTMAADPLNIASAFVPVVGQARYAAMAARIGPLGATLARGAIEGAAGQALLEPLIAADQLAQGNEYSLLDTLINLSFGAGLGTVLHGAAYGAGAGFRYMRNRYRVVEEPATRSVTVEKIDEAPPRQAVAEATESLRPETRDAAMRTAVAQLVQDRPVDVDAVLRADPQYGAVRDAMDAAAIADVEALQAQSAASARQVAGALEAPAEWQPTAQELKEARRIVRGWTPEVALREPLTLRDFVEKNGGLRQGPETQELAAAEVALRTQGEGRQADQLAQAARDAGYRFGPETRTGGGVDVDAFIKALIEEARGNRLLPDDAHTAAWAAQQRYFNELHDYLRDTLELDPRGMDARRLAWLLQQDPSTARLSVLLQKIDALDEHASLELAARLDQERAELERQILSDEPGAIEPDAPKADHRDVPAATLAELERYYADVEGTARETIESGRAPEEGPGARRPAEGGEAPPAGRGGDNPAAEGAGLRRAPGEEGPAPTQQGTASDLAAFAERQQTADLHADPGALARRDERLAGEAREVQKLLADDLADFGHLLDQDTKISFDLVGKMFDAETAGLNALAACRVGAA